MSRKKKQPKDDGFWPKRPGYNHLLGYVEEKVSPNKSNGIRERCIDRNVKDGKSLNQ